MQVAAAITAGRILSRDCFASRIDAAAMIALRFIDVVAMSMNILRSSRSRERDSHESLILDIMLIKGDM